MPPLAVVGVALGGALAAVLVGYNLRRVRLRTVAGKIPAAGRREILERIDRAGAEDGGHVVLLRVEGARTPSGHEPVGEAAGAIWPGSSGEGALLASIALRSPPLPPVWRGRHVVLSRGAAPWDVAARSELGSGTPEPRQDASSVPLRAVRLPRTEASAEDDATAPYDPRFLLERVPGLHELLGRRGRDAERLLPYVLVPGIATYEVDTYLVSLMGGEPELIQGDHGAVCPTCAAPLRFLFHLGDVLGLPGDAPVVYAYGCDAHPDHVEAFVDIH